MKLIDTILKLERDGYTLQHLCRVGMISPTIALYRDIYLFMDARRKCGVKSMQAITDAEEQFGVKKTTIYKAIRAMD
ncbi:hypothetical protein [Pedobacter sp. SYP-B3415]|uniref:hypothetical protein n=1 Tax=Pedobacter sp. SYP-B3415 TaxID=2496641 RepID=UPI00101D814E|nr:hypothetical protein [Pedobacter sp. SYP-B3415]